MKWDAEKYKKLSDMQYTIGINALSKLNPKKTDIILDIGCGYGNISREMAGKVSKGKVIALDIDSDMIYLAKEEAEKMKIQNISFINTNAVNIDFTNQFDCIFSNIVLHWIKDLEKLFHLMFKALKEDGRIMLASLFEEIESKNESQMSPSAVEQQVMMDLIQKGYFLSIMSKEEMMEVIAETQKHSHYKLYQIDTLKKMIENAGFSNVKIETEVRYKDFKDIDEYLDYKEVMVWGYFIPYYPKKYIDQVLDFLKKKIKEEWENIPKYSKQSSLRDRWPVVYIYADITKKSQ